MAKPICVMYIPNSFEGSGWEPDVLMRLLNGNFGHPEEQHPKYQITDYWSDYYWFCFYSHEIEVPEFKVFYDKDFTPINFEELKKYIESHFNKQKQQEPNY